MDTEEFEDPEDRENEGAEATPLDQILGAISDRSVDMQKAIDELSDAIEEFKMEAPEGRKGLVEPLDALNVAALEALRRSVPLVKAEAALKAGAEESCHQDALQQTHDQMQEILRLTNEAAALIAESNGR